MHREHQVRRHGAGADHAGEQERAGDRRRRPDPGLGLKVRQALPEGEVLDRRRQRKAEKRRRTSRATTCKQAEIAFVAGAAAAMLSKTGARQLCRRPGDPGHRQCRQGIRQRRAIRQSRRSSTSRTTPATSTTSPSPRKRRSPRSPRAPTSTTTSSISACAAWSRRRREKGTHIIGSYTDRCGTDPLYVAYIDHRRRLSGRVRDRAGGGRHVEAGATSRSAWRWGRSASGMVICKADARAEGQARGDQEGPPVAARSRC